MIEDSNSLAMCLAYGPSDGNTYGPLNWQDADGNLYAAASWEARPEWVTAAQSTLVRPEWDTEPYVVNMAGARRAQAALVFWVQDIETTAPVASTTKLTAVGGVGGIEALTLMGLSPYNPPETTE
jgi:hypothetical protein